LNIVHIVLIIIIIIIIKRGMRSIEFLIVLIFRLDDGDDVLSSNINSYHVTEDEFKSSIEIEGEQIYKISDKLYQKINFILSVI